MKNVSERIVQLRLTGAIVIDGVIARAGTLVELVEGEAKDLLRRGKAELHALPDDAGPVDDEAANATAAQAAADVVQDDASKAKRASREDK
ncbi:hypothetical protein [Burkholderia sp. TSV86]|uniref:hypothetical protein n=1 Tax=Burkholderia sp. TSV86 TaxID=1385594 RepID=UPI00075C7FDC|nr:hypothetical protein [Burkholderia sp. TSV86]KVE35260.1 hypothetical protein WS68_07630 [Burkholderia sp. TSV86]